MEQIKPMTQEDAIVLAFTDGNDSQTLLESKNLLLEESKESKDFKQIIHAMESYKDSHTAPLQAEIDRLNKEVKWLKNKKDQIEAQNRFYSHRLSIKMEIIRSNAYQLECKDKENAELKQMVVNESKEFQKTARELKDGYDKLISEKIKEMEELNKEVERLKHIPMPHKSTLIKCSCATPEDVICKVCLSCSGIVH